MRTRLTYLVLALLAVRPSVAQPATPVNGNSGGGSAVSRSDAIRTSKALFKEGNFAAGENTLLASSTQAPGTAPAYLESGATLAALAGMFRQDADGKTSVRLAKDALAQLRLAITKGSNDSRLTISAYTLIGNVQERLYGTREQAEASYSAAAHMGGAGSQTAAAALSRLQAGDALLAARAKKLGGN